MKKLKYFWMLWFLIPIYILTNYLVENHRDYSTSPIQEFIIGRWKLQEAQPANDFEVYEFEFISPSTMICNFKYSGGANYNTVFHYKFIGIDKIQITGRGGDRWEINRKGDLLVLHSDLWIEGTNIYKRTPILNWFLISLILGALLVGYLFDALIYLKVNNLTESKNDFNSSGYLDLYKNVVYNLIAVPVFGLGILIGEAVWNWPPLLRVRLPWDAVITIELAIMILILGIITIRNNRFVPKNSVSSTKLYLYYIGVLLIGYSLLGNLEGMVRLVMFLIFNKYPN